MSPNNSFLALFIFTTIILPSNCLENSICWTPVSDDLRGSVNLKPAGKDGPSTVYLCRVTTGCDTIPGKILTTPEFETITCFISSNGEERFVYPPFEVLQEPVETTSWVSYNGTLSSNNIPYGSMNNETVFVCRGIIPPNLISGILDSKQQTCRIDMMGGDTHELKQGFEVLVRNQYGIGKGVSIC